MQIVQSKTNAEEIGRRIKEARLNRGFSQWQLCQRLGFKSTKVLAGYETGRYPISEDLIKRCAKALNVTEDYILEGEKMAMSSVSTVPKKPEIAVVKPSVVTGELVPEDVAKPKPKYAANRNEYVWIHGDVLSENMKKAHMTNKEAAELVGANNASTVNAWRRGHNRLYKGWAKIFCEYFGITMDELVDKERNESEPQKWVNNLPNNKKKHKEEAVNPTTPITVTMEEKPMPELVTVNDRPIPANAEQVFCKNVKYYISERGLDEKTFLEKVGAAEGYLDDVIKHNFKIPMAVILKIGRELGISVEELATDNKAAIVEAEILELEKRMKDLRAMIGIA